MGEALNGFAGKTFIEWEIWASYPHIFPMGPRVVYNIPVVKGLKTLSFCQGTKGGFLDFGTLRRTVYVSC